MDVVLLTLTTLSLAAAAGFGALSWRVGREERERSRARIAALAAAMEPAPEARFSLEASPGHVRFPSDAADDQARPSAKAAAAPRVAVGSVFDRSNEALRGRPAITLAVVGVMLLAIAIGAIIGVRSGGAPSSGSASRAAAPLELVSMRYQREGATLTVTGLVRNPAAGAAVNGVTAVVFAFDGSGGFVASGRARLDVNLLAPGDESAFVVAVPNVSTVSRYRVSFRTDHGIVRHIDRRTDRVQLAQAER